MNDIAIQVQNLGKRYRLGVRKLRHDTLRDQIASGFTNLFHSKVSNESSRDKQGIFWALKDVSFVVREGEILGIIGRNGAGKSTLLKILTRITMPTHGNAEIHGNVGSLLEVGTGFHPELTGRENIYLNGAILGMRKAEIDKKFDSIVAFADIDRFIETPVKRYSSGMYIRLAFAVAAHMQPEVLLIDEVLAVGDVAFQQKCIRRMGEVAAEGRTVLFVSHNMAAVENLCTRVITLESGKIKFEGSPKDGIRNYLKSISEQERLFSSHIFDLSGAARKSGHGASVLRSMEILKEDGTPFTGSMIIGEPLKLKIESFLERPTAYFSVAVRLTNGSGHTVLVLSSEYQPNWPTEERIGRQTVICTIPSLTLLPGEYRIEALFDIGPSCVDHVEDAARISVLPGDYYSTGRLPRMGAFVLRHHWELI